MKANSIIKITSWLKFLVKNLRLVGCATVCAKSEVMLKKKVSHNDVGVFENVAKNMVCTTFLTIIICISNKVSTYATLYNSIKFVVLNKNMCSDPDG